jgi:hypothetical protein
MVEDVLAEKLSRDEIKKASKCGGAIILRVVGQRAPRAAVRVRRAGSRNFRLSWGSWNEDWATVEEGSGPVAAVGGINAVVGAVWWQFVGAVFIRRCESGTPGTGLARA